MVCAIEYVMLLATTALALTMHFSGFFNSQLQARRAVQNNYGLTDEMMDLFTYEAVETTDGTVAVFSMNIAHREQLGSYVVYRAQDGKLTASWSG